MTVEFDAAWQEITRSPLFGITVTLAAYALSLRVWERTGRQAFVHPVLVSIVLIGAALGLTHVPYQDYWTGGSMIGLLLGPATVALAVPLYRQSAQIRRSAALILTSLTVGAAAAISAAVLIVRLSGGNVNLAMSMAPKSATAPVAIALADGIGGIPSLAAVFAILTGILGAVAGPALLDLVRIRDQRYRGLAMGLSAHGIGTARVLQDDPTAGAFSGLAMGLGALLTSLLLPAMLLLLN